MKALTYLLALLSLNALAGEPVTDKSDTKKAKKKAIAPVVLSENERLQNELVALNEKLKSASNNVELLTEKAALLFDLKKFTAAEETIDAAILNKPSTGSETFLLAGRIYFMTGDYENAIRFLNQYIAVVGDKKALREGATDLLADALHANDEMHSWKDVKLESLTGLNSEYDESNPVLSADGKRLFFSSNRPAKGLINNNETRIYFSDWNDATQTWGDVKPYELIYGLKGFSALLSFAHDGKSYFLSKKDEFANEDIYFVNFDAKKSRYDAPIALEEGINTEGNEISASISKEMKRLFFVSDELSGKGNYDIFWSVKESKTEWASPSELSNIINTEKDEKFVYRQADGKKIFFISNGHPGYGGFDIYLSETLGDDVKAPFNLGMPINSKYDENDFSFSLDGSKLLFTSNRPGGKGSNDIFMANMSDYNVIENEASKQVKGLLKGKLTNDKGLSLAQKTIEIYNEDQRTLFTSLNSNEEGEYEVKLNVGSTYFVQVKIEGFKPVSEKVTMKPGISGKPIVGKNICLAK